MKHNMSCHKINKDGHEGHLHGNTYFINKKFTWIINVLYVLLATFYLILKLVKPTNDLKYFLYPPIWIVLTTIIIFTVGLKYFQVYKKLIKNKFLSVNLLMAIAAHSMFIFSIIISIVEMINKNTNFASMYVMWPAIIYIIALMDIGHAIEGMLNKSSQKGFDKLKKLLVRKVHLKQNNKIIDASIEKIKKGDVILVKKNEVVPLDGILISEWASIDNSNITGESEYIHLKKDKYVISGAINKSDDIYIKVNKTLRISTINRIIKKIEDSTKKITHQQSAIDKLVKILIPIIFLISIFTFGFWMFMVSTNSISSFPWKKDLNQYSLPFYAFFAVLDIAAPCALGMAVPLVTMVSSFIGGINSIVFNSTQKIEEINNATIVAFDKTGTITENKFEITNIIGDKKYLKIAKSLEQDIEHPIAKTICESINEKNVIIKNKKNHPGIGVSGTYNKKSVFIKRSKPINKQNSTSTIISLYIDKKPMLTFYLKPKIKKNAKYIIEYLLKKNKRVIMITGDHKNAAQNIANEVGIKEIYYEKSPKQKMEIIKKLKQKGKVIFIGDGFNDLIASKEADISISFASGDNILNDFSDVSLITNNLIVLKKLFNLSKMHLKFSKISILSVFLFSFALIPLAMILMIPPFLGAIIMILIDVGVVFNAFIYKKIGTKKI